MRRCLSDRATREARDATRRRAASRAATTGAGRRASRTSRRPAGPPRRRRRRVEGPRVARRERPVLASARASRRHTQDDAEGHRRAAPEPTNASPSKRAGDASTSPRDVVPAPWRPRMARDTGAGRSGECPVWPDGHIHQPAVFPKSARATSCAARLLLRFPSPTRQSRNSPCLEIPPRGAWEAVWKICPHPISGLGQTDPGLASRFARVALARRSVLTRDTIAAPDQIGQGCAANLAVAQTTTRTTGVVSASTRARAVFECLSVSGVDPSTRTPQGDPPLPGIG